MLVRRESNIQQRLRTFAENLQRANRIADHSNTLKDLEARDVAVDIKRAAIIFAVGSIDELCKGLFLEVIEGTLMGDISVPNSPKSAIPSGVALLFLEASACRSLAKTQLEALAVLSLQQHLERDNFQSYDQISKRFSECGLGKLRDSFVDVGVREEFRETLGTLANVRHSAVHRLGLVDNNRFISNDDDVVELIISDFPGHCRRLRAGGEILAEGILAHISPVPRLL